MTEPRLLDTVEATRRWVREAQSAGERVGLVPTMGALHDGHLSLVRAARAECDRVIASIFVNPTQFAPGEDFERYPRDLAADAARLREAGCDAVFAPSVGQMYPEGFATQVLVAGPALPFEGAERPTHFGGVATVVAKLFSIAPADAAYLGQKDYQQTVVVRRLVEDLNLPIEVVVCSTVREPDGLAMSSRNAYLSPEERSAALSLSRGLFSASDAHAAGERDAHALRALVEDAIGREPAVKTDYVALVRDGTVEPTARVDYPAVLLVAARVGRTRLIDNVRLA